MAASWARSSGRITTSSPPGPASPGPRSWRPRPPARPRPGAAPRGGGSGRPGPPASPGPGATPGGGSGDDRGPPPVTADTSADPDRFFDRATPGAHEWWYFDAIGDDGRDVLVIVWYAGLPFD